MEYKMKCTVRYSECDEKGLVRLHQILNYFQDCATLQAESVGYGLGRNKEEGQAWFLLAYDIRIIRPLALFEEIDVITEPYRMKGHYGYRRFRICGRDGRAAIRADSVWILMDTRRGLPKKIPDEMSLAFVPDDDGEKVTIKRKIRPLSKDWTKVADIPVTEIYVDSNRHVNNNWYAQWAEGLYSSDSLKAVRIDYRKAALEGDHVYGFLQEEDRQAVIKYDNQDGDLLAYIRLEASSMENRD